MISFFRKIRQKLLKENRVTRYLAYAVGEILLVVIGILIALQVNTWNENRKKLAVSRETIVNLKAELEEAKVELERAYHFNRENRRLSQEFIDGEISLDSLRLAPHMVFSYTGFAQITLNLPILERKLSSDKSIQGKEELIHQLRTVQNEYNSIVSIISNMERLWSNQVAPYYTKTNTMVVYNQFLNKKEIELEFLLPILEDQEYKNLVAAINSFSFQLVDKMKSLNENLSITISYLESEKH
ncbi:DUF6090 family protein [Aquiflexum gelatinilyticum]|uniref:DUF6090 family protein n=1 Tax=Aquiflexum gelatinilyticum TaxID=2961943 RepID=UPI002167AE18|nr:DUF6090 family protein [Aquiflexum gelatinilyticum]MCS4435243.1 DUF6090 family protein [Aquiflexum gelatinilyticum]